MRFGHILGSADPVRVLHLTDPHLFADTGGDLRGTVTYAALQKVIADYSARDWRADCVALTGDLIQDDSQAAYGHCRELLSGLDVPVHCVPGNHDVRSLMRDALTEPPFVYCGSAEIANWLIIGVDSCVSGRAGGSVPDYEFLRLEQLIAASDAIHVLVCLHHPPVAMGSKWLDTVGLDNGDEFLDRMQESGAVRAAISGHVHQEYDADHGGIRVIATPSTCRQFLPGSDEFALDDKPPAYRRISLYSDGQIETELVWVGDD